MGKHEHKTEDVPMADASTVSAADASIVSKKSKKEKKEKKDKKSKSADTEGDASVAVDTEGDEKTADSENLSPIARTYTLSRLVTAEDTIRLWG